MHKRTDQTPLEAAAITDKTAASKPAVLTVEEWAEKMRISRGAGYAAVKNGEVDGVNCGAAPAMTRRQLSTASE